MPAAVHSCVAECTAVASGPGVAVTVQDSTGPASGWPSRTWQESVIWTCRTRSLPANVPLVLPASSSTQLAPAAVSVACCHDTSGSSTTMSEDGSRPIR